MDLPRRGTTNGVSNDFLRQDAEKELAWSRSMENSSFQYCYLEGEYQRLFHFQNDWTNSNYVYERAVPQYLVPYLVNYVLAQPNKFFVNTSQLYYHPGVDKDPELKKMWFKLDGVIMVANKRDIETTKDDQLASGHVFGESDTEQFVMIIHGGFYRMSGDELYALPGGYITNVDCIEALNYDDQLLTEMAELSRKRCLKTLSKLATTLSNYDFNNVIGDINNTLKLDMVELPSEGFSKDWKTILKRVENREMTDDCPIKLNCSDLYFSPVEAIDPTRLSSQVWYPIMPGYLIPREEDPIFGFLRTSFWRTAGPNQPPIGLTQFWEHVDQDQTSVTSMSSFDDFFPPIFVHRSYYLLLSLVNKPWAKWNKHWIPLPAGIIIRNRNAAWRMGVRLDPFGHSAALTFQPKHVLRRFRLADNLVRDSEENEATIGGNPGSSTDQPNANERVLLSDFLSNSLIPKPRRVLRNESIPRQNRRDLYLFAQLMANAQQNEYRRQEEARESSEPMDE